MSTTTIFEDLQAINLGVTGIKTAPTTFPAVLNDADLPMAVVYPEEADHRTASTKVARRWRNWVIRVYVKATSLGKGIGEGFAETMPILDALVETYEVVAIQQGTGNTWDDLNLVSDDGVTLLTLHDTVYEGQPQYWGTRIRLRIATFEEE